MHRGYFPLYRKFQDHIFWKEKRVFSKAEAWIDLLWEAQHDEKPQEVLIGLKILICNYGESLKSIRTWGKRWRWSEKKVWNFFKLLKKMRQIDTVNETVTTRVIVLNYEKYDPRKIKNETVLETVGKQSGNSWETVGNTDKNDKNVKNNKYSVDFLKFHEVYPIKVEKKATFEKWKSLQKQKLLPSLDDLLSAIEKQKKWRENTNGEFRPKWKHPKTWLNQGCWEDEIPENEGTQKTKIIKAGDMSIYD